MCWIGHISSFFIPWKMVHNTRKQRNNMLDYKYFMVIFRSTSATLDEKEILSLPKRNLLHMNTSIGARM